MTVSMVLPGDGSDTALDPLVVMVTRSTTEDAVLRAWVAEHRTGAVVVRADAAAVRAQSLGDDRLVTPVKVTWVPAAGAESQARLADVVALPMRRRPWRVLQPLLLRRRPGRVVVVEGDAASVGDLRRAFEAESAAGGDDLAAFVVRRAVLACERAERRVIGDRYKVPRLMVDQITAGARYRERATPLASRLGIGEGEFLERARSCLTEMLAVQSPPAIDAFRAITSPMHSRTWTVDVDTTGIERLRELGKSATLVFLPSHRSYADPLVLAEVLHQNDFPRNHVLGGSNMSFWPLGPLGRRAGMVFIRRTFGDDTVYKFAFREYLGHLMAKRFPLEWYIEGGRTRTGKLRRPRFGVLRYLVDAMGQEPGTDAVLVPVSIIYDQLHEVGAVVAEQAGAVKRAEGLRWMVRYLRDQRRHIGAARVRFGEPFSLRSALDEVESGPAQLEKVAFRICAGINAATPVMATAVATFALLDAGGRALTFSQVMAVAKPLLTYLQARGAAGSFAELSSPVGLRRALDELADAGVVSCYEGGREPVWSIEPAHAHIAAFYRNGAVHHLVDRALVELALLHAEATGADGDLRAVGEEHTMRLRDLLKFEFFFPDKREFRANLARELDLIDPEWRTYSPAGAAATRLLDSCRTIVAPRAVHSIVEAQLVVAEQLLRLHPAVPVDQQEFLASCLSVGRQMLLQGRIKRPDAVSRELFGGALRLAVNRGLVGAPDTVPDTASGLVRRRREFQAEVADVLDLLDRGERRDATLLEEVLRGHDRPA